MKSSIKSRLESFLSSNIRKNIRPSALLDRMIVGWERTLSAFWDVAGLWYWLFPDIKRGRVVVPILTLFTIYLLGKSLQDALLSTDTLSRASLIVSLVIGSALAMSLFIHRVWPRPAMFIQGKWAVIPESKQLKNLMTLLLVLLMSTFLIMEVLTALGAMKSIFEWKPIESFLLSPLVPYWTASAFKGFLSSSIAIIIFRLLEFAKSRPPLSRKSLVYAVSTWLICGFVSGIADQYAV